MSGAGPAPMASTGCSVSVDRERGAQSGGLGGDLGLDIGIAEVLEDVADPAGQGPALLDLEAAAGHRRGTDAQARGDERPLPVVWHRVLVHRDPGPAQI